MGHTILVADDESEIRQLLRLYLEKEGHIVLEAEDGLQALEIYKNKQPDMALLDIMMPKLNGYQTMQKIREDSNIPIIMISAKGQDTDKILGLDLGADDYIAKPFNPLEAVSRINSNLRRFYSLGSGEKTGKTLLIKDLKMDTDACQAYKNDVALDLTSIEFKILKLLMENPGRVFTKQQLYEAGWEEKYIAADNNIMVCISKLRTKLADDKEEYIRTIRGLGYRMEK